MLAPVEDPAQLPVLGEKSEAFINGLMRTLETGITKRFEAIQMMHDKMLSLEEFRKNEAIERLKEMV